MNSEVRPLWKRVITVILPIIGGIFVVQSTFSLYQLARRGDVIGREAERLKQLEGEQEQLKKQISRSYTQEFIEREARNKLGLIKPGETLVYLEKDATEGSQPKSELILNKPEQMTILQQWWDVFF